MNNVQLSLSVFIDLPKNSALNEIPDPDFNTYAAVQLYEQMMEKEPEICIVRTFESKHTKSAKFKWHWIEETQQFEIKSADWVMRPSFLANRIPLAIRLDQESMDRINAVYKKVVEFQKILKEK